MVIVSFKYRKIPKLTNPESNIKKSRPQINPESSDLHEIQFKIIRLVTSYIMDWRDSHTSIGTETPTITG